MARVFASPAKDNNRFCPGQPTERKSRVFIKALDDSVKIKLSRVDAKIVTSKLPQLTVLCVDFLCCINRVSLKIIVSLE